MLNRNVYSFQAIIVSIYYELVDPGIFRGKENWVICYSERTLQYGKVWTLYLLTVSNGPLYYTCTNILVLYTFVSKFSAICVKHLIVA